MLVRSEDQKAHTIVQLVVSSVMFVRHLSYVLADLCAAMTFFLLSVAIGLDEQGNFSADSHQTATADSWRNSTREIKASLNLKTANKT